MFFRLMFFSVYISYVSLTQPECHEQEYNIQGICCPKCRPGKMISEDCTEKVKRTCTSCPNGTFQEGLNQLRQCGSNCTKCDAGPGLKEKRSCNSKSDALCEPLDGFFCSDSNGGGCRAAQRHTVCGPGHFIGQSGTADKDTECLHCADGTFSDGASSSCQPHKKCESVGLELMKPGTDSTDSECGKHGSHTGLVAGGVIAGVLLVMALIIAAIIQREKIRVWIDRHQKKMETQEPEMELTETSPLKSSDSPAPTGDQQQPTTTTSAATIDGHDGDQSLGPAPPSCPTHNGSVSGTVHQEDAAIVSPSSDNCTINVGDPPVIFKGDIGAA